MSIIEHFEKTSTDWKLFPGAPLPYTFRLNRDKIILQILLAKMKQKAFILTMIPAINNHTYRIPHGYKMSLPAVTKLPTRAALCRVWTRNEPSAGGMKTRYRRRAKKPSPDRDQRIPHELRFHAKPSRLFRHPRRATYCRLPSQKGVNRRDPQRSMLLVLFTSNGIDRAALA